MRVTNSDYLHFTCYLPPAFSAIIIPNKFRANKYSVSYYSCMPHGKQILSKTDEQQCNY